MPFGKRRVPPGHANPPPEPRAAQPVSPSPSAAMAKPPEFPGARRVTPDIAALIVMEAAIPMSKIDPRTVPGGTIVK